MHVYLLWNAGNRNDDISDWVVGVYSKESDAEIAREKIDREYIQEVIDHRLKQLARGHAHYGLTEEEVRASKVWTETWITKEEVL